LPFPPSPWIGEQIVGARVGEQNGTHGKAG
jgi:hypothetical protein